MKSLPINFQQILEATPVLIAGCVILVLMLLVLYWLIRRRRVRPVPLTRADMFIDVNALDQRGPSDELARLEFYNLPVRLAVIVIAPVGRDRATPSREETREILDAIIPGLKEIAADHHPEIRLWPAQLSVQGFHQAFFNNVALPGKRGKGSPWCSLAGKFSVHGHPFVAGLVCRSAANNAAGQVIVQHEAQWMDILRLRQK